MITIELYRQWLSDTANYILDDQDVACSVKSLIAAGIEYAPVCVEADNNYAEWMVS